MRLRWLSTAAALALAMIPSAPSAAPSSSAASSSDGPVVLGTLELLPGGYGPGLPVPAAEEDWTDSNAAGDSVLVTSEGFAQMVRAFVYDASDHAWTALPPLRVPDRQPGPWFGRVAIDGRRSVTLAWLRDQDLLTATYGPVRTVRFDADQQQWGPIQAIPGAEGFSDDGLPLLGLDADDSGVVSLAWAERQQVGFAQWRDGSWGAASTVPGLRSATGWFRVRLVTAARGTVFVTTVRTVVTEPEPRVSVLYPDGAWIGDTPVPVDPRGTWPDVNPTVNGRGDAAFAWQEQASPPEMRVRRFDASTRSWGPIETIAVLSDGAGGQLQASRSPGLALADDGALLVAWVWARGPAPVAAADHGVVYRQDRPGSPWREAGAFAGALFPQRTLAQARVAWLADGSPLVQFDMPESSCDRFPYSTLWEDNDCVGTVWVPFRSFYQADTGLWTRPRATDDVRNAIVDDGRTVPASDGTVLAGQRLWSPPASRPAVVLQEPFDGAAIERGASLVFGADTYGIPPGAPSRLLRDGKPVATGTTSSEFGDVSFTVAAAAGAYQVEVMLPDRSTLTSNAVRPMVLVPFGIVGHTIRAGQATFRVAPGDLWCLDGYRQQVELTRNGRTVARITLARMYAPVTITVAARPGRYQVKALRVPWGGPRWRYGAASGIVTIPRR